MQYFIDGKYRKIYYNKSTGISFYKSRGKEVNVSHMFKKNGELKQQYKTELNNVNKLNNKTDSNNVNKLNNKTELNNTIKNNPSILIRKTKKKKKRFLGGGNINFAMISPEITIEEITAHSKPADIVDFYIDLYRVTILVLSNLLARYDKTADPAIVPDTLPLTTVIISAPVAAQPDNVTIQELLNCLINLFNAHSTKDFSTPAGTPLIEEPDPATFHTTGNLIIEDLAFLRTWSLTANGAINTIKFNLVQPGDPAAPDANQNKIAQKFLPLDSYIPILRAGTADASSFGIAGGPAPIGSDRTSDTHEFVNIAEIVETKEIVDIKMKIQQSAFDIAQSNGGGDITADNAIADGARNIDIPDSINKYDTTAAPGTPREFNHNSLTILIEIIKIKMERMRELKIAIMGGPANNTSINDGSITGIAIDDADAPPIVKAAILLKHYLALKTANPEIFRKLFK